VDLIRTHHPSTPIRCYLTAVRAVLALLASSVGRQLEPLAAILTSLELWVLCEYTRALKPHRADQRRWHHVQRVGFPLMIEKHRRVHSCRAFVGCEACVDFVLRPSTGESSESFNLSCRRHRVFPQPGPQLHRGIIAGQMRRATITGKIQVES